MTLRTIDEEFGVVNPANPGVLPGAGALLVFTSIIYDHDRQGANSWSSVDRFARDLLVTETPGILVIGGQDSIVTEGWSYEETGPQRELLGNYPPFSWSITFYSATNHFQNPESNESSWGEMEESNPRVLTQHQYVSRPQRILGF